MSRFAVGGLLLNASPIEKLPIGVLTCNIVGSFLIGLLVSLPREQTPSWLPPLLIVGFLGGFTTFSSFGVESIKMLQSGAISLAAGYILVSVLGSLGAIFIAFKIMR